MLIVISPAKALSMDKLDRKCIHSQAQCLSQAQQLVNVLKTYTPEQLADLMCLSDKLASLNYARYTQWQLPFSQENAKQAVFMFNGDVYDGLQAAEWTDKALVWAQSHLRILSGLYGYLRPMDLIQPYRLEMGTKLAVSPYKDLYEFWGQTQTHYLKQELTAQSQEDAVLVNLASNEYFKVVDAKQFNVVTPVFQDKKNGKYKIISFYAKKARGLMVQFIIRHRLTRIKDLTKFSMGGYLFDSASSDEQTLVFKRDHIE